MGEWTNARRAAAAAGFAAALFAAACTSSQRRSVPTETPGASPTGSPAPFYHEDFEPPGGGAGWSTGYVTGTSNSWQIVSPASITPYQGTTVLGTAGTSGGYAPSEDSFALSPQWNLPAGTPYTFTIYHYYDAGLGRDGGRIEYTTDGGTTWPPLTPSSAYNSTIQYTGNSAGWPIGTPCFTGVASGWSQITVPMGPYAGNVVRLRFHFTADATVQSDGWYLDEATIR